MTIHKKWTEELEQELMAPFPDACVEILEGSGGAPFVTLFRYTQRLNELVGPHGWSCDIVRRDNIGENLVTDVAITILDVTKVNTGSEVESEFHKSKVRDDGKSNMYGSPATNSYAQAFKRTCTLGFGMALEQLYDKSTRNGARPSGRASTGSGGSSSGGGAPNADFPCPKCGGAMFDNRAQKKPGDKFPDFKCAEKGGECKDGKYATSLWWDAMVEDLEALVGSAEGLAIITAAQAKKTLKLGPDGKASEVFKATAYLRLELDKQKVSTTPISEPDDELPF